MTDRELYKKCVLYGKQALRARRKFMGLLPEVNKRELSEWRAGRSWLRRRGFESIYVFAAKLAGMSRDQVDVVLRLGKKFEAMPALQKVLVTGEVSPNKLIRIASVATAENQNFLAEKVKLFSQKALEIFVKEERLRGQNGNETTVPGGEGGAEGDGAWNALRECESSFQNLLFKPLFDSQSLRAQTLKLDEDVEGELMEMQDKGIDVNDFLRKCLERRKQKIDEEKAKLAIEAEAVREGKAQIGMSVSRHVPAKIRRIIRAEYGFGCAGRIGGKRCNRRAVNLHHVKRFAKVRAHDPRFLKPLCAGHHELEHVGERAAVE